MHTVKACKRELVRLTLFHFEVENSIFQSKKSYIYFYCRVIFLEKAFYFKFFVGCFKKTAMSVIAEVYTNNSTLNCAAMLW